MENNLIISISISLAEEADPCLSWDNEDGTFATSLDHVNRMKDSGVAVNDDWLDEIKQILAKSIYRLNRLLPSDKNTFLDRFPLDVNYSTDLTIGLTTKTVDYFGLRVAQIGYQTLDPITLQKIEPLPVVLEKYEYFWDDNNLYPTDRIKKIQFYHEDGSVDPEAKILPKTFYSASDRAEITTYRRESIVNWLIARATELGMGNTLKLFFGQYQEQTNNYIMYADTDILNIVTNSSEPWMDVNTGTPLGTVRQSILACFTKALQATPNTEINAYLRSLHII